MYTLDSMSGVWAWQGVLKAPYVRNSAFCGLALAIAGDLVAVGCPGDPSPSTAVDVDEALETGTYVGAAHAWRLDAANASASDREGYLKAATAAGSQQFGNSVAVAAEKVLPPSLLDACTMFRGSPERASVTMSSPTVNNTGWICLNTGWRLCWTGWRHNCREPRNPGAAHWKPGLD